jgi:hypothetical protein
MQRYLLGRIYVLLVRFAPDVFFHRTWCDSNGACLAPLLEVRGGRCSVIGLKVITKQGDPARTKRQARDRFGQGIEP